MLPLVFIMKSVVVAPFDFRDESSSSNDGKQRSTGCKKNQTETGLNEQPWLHLMSKDEGGGLKGFLGCV